jgi:DNA-binding NarL/FixJ family response regulator
VPRVLLADDDAPLRAQLAATLEDRVPGADVVGSVGDGHSAVAAALDHLAPDLVLIDYSMPGPNGGHAASVIRQALPETEVVILSGVPASEMDDVAEGVEVVPKGAGMEAAVVAVIERQR